MKPLTAFLLLVVALETSWIVYREWGEAPRETSDERATEAKITSLTHSLDSIGAAQELTRDSLQATFAVMQAKDFEIQQANKEKQLTAKDHEKDKAIPVPIANDTLRHRAIKELFHSYPVPR